MIDSHTKTKWKPLSEIPSVRPFDWKDLPMTKMRERKLPHWTLTNSTYFITFNVHENVGSPFMNPQLAKTFEEIILDLHETDYLLLAYVIMSNHSHLIIKPLENKKLGNILKIIKGRSSKIINKMMNRIGNFWQRDSFDHIIRHDGSMKEKWEYIKNNPVKAGVVFNAEDYPFSSFYKGKCA